MANRDGVSFDGGRGRNQEAFAVGERSAAESKPIPPRTNGERVAVSRLEAALREQARLGDAFARLAGTQAEQSAYLRLQAASLHVSRCDQLVKAVSR